MSAPMENIAGELKVETTHEIPEGLDLSSPNLDPLKALYAENIYLPSKNPTLFNNLAEYENVVIKGRTASVLPGRGRGKARPGAIHKKIQTKPSKSQDDGNDSQGEDEAAKRARQQRENMHRNVLTRMSSFDKGPLTILRRAVEEHLRVKVWIRSAVTYRGYCKAFLIAFDKHFNLALMDVDETYRLPKVIRKSKKSKRDENTKSEDKPSPVGGADTNPADENALNLDIQVQQISERTELRSDGEDTDSGLAATTKKLSIDMQKETNNRSLESSNQSGTVNIATSSKCATVEDIQNNNGDTPYTQTETGAITSTMDHDDTEIEYVTKHRHVNQLFVRGDNVVSVVLLN